jgi:hypothetical protein
MPSLAEHGARIPAAANCALWVVVALVVGRALKRMDGAADRLWRRGLWALGVITPGVFFALLLGLVVGMIGAKSFSGMTVVALGFGIAIVSLAGKWKRRLTRAASSTCECVTSKSPSLPRPEPPREA